MLSLFLCFMGWFCLGFDESCRHSGCFVGSSFCGPCLWSESFYPAHDLFAPAIARYFSLLIRPWAKYQPKMVLNLQNLFLWQQRSTCWRAQSRTLKNRCCYLDERSLRKSLLFLDKSTRKLIVLLNPPPLEKFGLSSSFGYLPSTIMRRQWDEKIEGDLINFKLKETSKAGYQHIVEVILLLIGHNLLPKLQ